MAVGAAGAAIALWSILSFIVVGRGTPAPFDPPRLLVVTGTVDAYVRNPMYCGASLALARAALFYQSGALLDVHRGVRRDCPSVRGFYEKPTLARLFDGDDDYYNRRSRVPRWRPTHLDL